jgi:hypothetical protein
LKNISTIVSLLLLATLATEASAEQESLTLTSGVDYSSGKYGQSEKTNITYIPLTGKYETGRWSFKATLPWLRIDGPGGVSGDSRVITNSVVNNKRSTESGQGDIVASATFSALELNVQKFYLDLSAKVKLPTASESRGLGTGKTDYALSADIYKTFNEFTALATLGYRFLGDPAGVNLKDVWFGTIGGVYKINGFNNIGVTVDFREPTTSTGTKLREYTLFYSHKFNDTYKLQTYLVSGDTTSSVDFGGGVMLGVNW